MLAKDLLNRLERLGLLDQEIIEALREQLAQSGARVTPEKIAQLLVENGQLTRFQATKLIGELRSAEAAEEQPAEVLAGEPVNTSDDLDLADGFEDAPANPTVGAANPRANDAEPVEAELVEAVPVVEAYAEPIESDSAGFQQAMNGSRPRKVNATKKVRDQHRSVWDSFKIYGVAGIVTLLLLVSGLLYFVLRKGDADGFIKRANDSYNQQAYAAAEKDFTAFLANFGQEHQHSSIARTRLAMSQLYQFAQYTDPVRAVTEAERLLPTIENEPGLEEERNNLAALLVDVADNIAKAAGNSPDTQAKQQLLSDLDRQIRLTENPVYVTSSARRALAAKLLGVNETRARVQRDIDRNLRLDESVAAMEAALAQKQTDKAYETRKQLLVEFPELRNHERLVGLVKSASEIQQTLVKTATSLPAVETAMPTADAVKNVVLTNRTGGEAPGLADEVFYVRAHGSILAFAARDGSLLWRRYVGYGQSHAPIAIDPSGLEGVLLSDADTLEVRRCDATTGNVLWRASIGEAFSQPVAFRDEIFLSTVSGRLINLDAQSGEARWATQIPQSLDLSPGINDRPGKLYLPGNHSNLYVIEKRSGTCTESFYLGHAPGTIAVAPVALQGGDSGHLFVFENAAPDYANMHVLKCDPQGGALVVAQPPFRLTGNVTVDPILVLGRRLIVLTDRAEIAVFDIEQTAATADQVSQVAKQVASYDSPTSAQMAVDKNQMWVSGTRLGRYELQVSTGRVARDWVANEGDAFIGQPRVIGDALFHARVLRGTSGVRVTAAETKSGKPYWQTDVGVPVSMITPAPGGKSYHVVTAQAALFELNAQALSEGETTAPIENPGGTGVAMRFEDPAFIDPQRALLLNRQTGGQLGVYDATREREKLRLITLALPDGKPAAAGLIAGNGFLLPLDSGRVVLMNWQTGGALGSPFQPPSDPNQKVSWSDPVALPSDPDQVLIADSRKKVYRLRVGEQVRELASANLESPWLGKAAILGESIFATTSGPAADFLVSHDVASLQAKTPRLLDGRVVWGPYVVGQRVLLQTDDGQLRGFDPAGEPTFNVPLPDRDLVNGLTAIGETVVLTGQSGWLVTLDLAAGTAIGKADLSQPLSGPPVVAGKRLLVPGREGVVYITDIPSTPERP
jgi:outer membrane protein assembly factor BamB